MTSTDFDRQLQEWLVSQAPAGWRAPDGLLASVTARVDRTAQRPSWLARASAGALGAGAAARAMPAMQGALLLLKIVLIIALAAAVVGAVILLTREDHLARGQLGYTVWSTQAELYRGAPSGGDERLILTDVLWDCPATTRDGSVLAWWPASPPSGLRTLTYESGEWIKREHPSIRSAIGWPPAIAPDGAKVAFDSGSAGDGQVLANLYVASLGDDEEPRLVTDEVAGVMYLAWSPDGSRIALTGSYIDGSREREGLFVVAPEGPDLTMLASVDKRTETIGMFSWSPDGKSIAYSRGPWDSPPELYVVNVDGSGERLLTTGSAPAWSPDGKRIAFLIYDGGYLPAIIEADGTNMRIISGPVHFRFAWSPDGSALVFAAEDDPGGLLVIETAGNGETKRVDPSPPPQSRGCVYWWADLPTQP